MSKIDYESKLLDRLNNEGKHIPKITLSRIDIESNADKRKIFYKSFYRDYGFPVIYTIHTNFGITRIDLK